MLEQANLDGGRFEIAWLLTLLEEPPSQVFTPQPPIGRRAPFAPLASQSWTTVALAFLKEQDVLIQRRTEVTANQRQGNLFGAQGGKAAQPAADGSASGSGASSSEPSRRKRRGWGKAASPKSDPP